MLNLIAATFLVYAVMPTEPREPLIPFSTPGLSIHDDLSYGPESWQKMDVYVPDNPALRPVPLLVFLHGAGTSASDEDLTLTAFWGPVFDAKIAVASIDYRGYDEPELGPYPGPQRDLFYALATLHSPDLAAQLGYDPSMIGVGGRSFGAMVTGSYLFGPRNTPGLDPVFWVNVQGMLDWTSLAEGTTPAWAHVDGAAVPDDATTGASALAWLRLAMEGRHTLPSRPPTLSLHPAEDGSLFVPEGGLTDVHDLWFSEELFLRQRALGINSVLLTGEPFDASTGAKMAEWIRSVTTGA